MYGKLPFLRSKQVHITNNFFHGVSRRLSTGNHTSVGAQPCRFLAESVWAINGFRAKFAEVEQ